MMDRIQLQALIVDDNDDNRLIFRYCLKSAGYTTTEALDGKQALELLEQSEPFHLMILDLQMPQVNGVKVLKQMQTMSKTAATFVIVATANPHMTVSDDVQDRADHILQKPIDVHQLMLLSMRLQSTQRNTAG
jgi:CheY-like chemotaxis protein